MKPLTLSDVMKMSMPSVTYRKIFPSHDWDDEWYVNQIVRLPNIIGKENIGFLDAVPNEEIKSNNCAIKKWIDEQMAKCSCVILFVGENTYRSKWCRYEIDQANKLQKGRFIINLDGMKNKDGSFCKGGPDPYKEWNMYSTTPNPAFYTIKQYTWSKIATPETQIGEWIEDACIRAGK